MPPIEELIENSKFPHQFERGRVHRVPRKIAREIRVFFEHLHGNLPTGTPTTQQPVGTAGGDGLSVSIAEPACQRTSGSSISGRWDPGSGDYP